VSANENGLDSREVQPVKIITKHTTEFTPKQKRLENLIAGFAQRGHAVYELGNEDFVVTRWGMSRHVPDYAALVAFGRMLGVQQ
jgi:hypothetical protein